MSLVKFTLASPLSPALLSWNLILYLINIYINKFHVDQEHSTGVDVQRYEYKSFRFKAIFPRVSKVIHPEL